MAVMVLEPVKSQQDRKSYKRLKLDNGLDVMLIHDPEMEASPPGHADADMTTDDDQEGEGSSLQVCCGITRSPLLHFRYNRHMSEVTSFCRVLLRRTLIVSIVIRATPSTSRR